MTNLDRGKGFDMKIRIKRAQPVQKVEIPFFLQAGVQPADHMHFSDSKAERIAYHVDDFLNGVLKGVGVAFFSGESAELAGEDANIRIIDVTIVDVRRVIAVLSLALDIGDHSKRIQVARTVQLKSVSL